MLTDWKRRNGGGLPKTVFPARLNKLLQKLSNNLSKNILSGFESTGIRPINKNKVLSKLIPNGHKRMNDAALTDSFDEIIQANTATQLNVPNRNIGRTLTWQQGRLYN